MEKAKVNYLVIILVFCVVIVGIGAFWLGSYFSNESYNEPSLEKEVNIEELGNKLYDMYGEDLFYFYKYNYLKSKSKMDYNALINTSLDVGIKNNYANDLAFITALSDNKVAISDSKEIYFEKGVATNYSYSLKKDIFTKYYQKLFGSDKKINYEDFEYSNYECRFESELLNCYLMAEGGDWDPIGFVYYSHTAKEGNELNVFVKVLGYDIYNIANFTVFKGFDNEDVIVDHDDDLKKFINGDVYNEDGVKEYLYKTYIDKAQEYKIVFRQEKDNWYWVRTEMVK